MARYRHRQGMRGPKRKKPRARPQAAAAGLPDTEEARLEEQTRADVARLVKMRSKDLGLSESERLLDRVLAQHPEHAELFENAADWVVTGNPESPFLHVALHRIVEQRVVSREIGTFDGNVPWHDAVHAAADNVATELFGAEDELEGAEA